MEEKGFLRDSIDLIRRRSQSVEPNDTTQLLDLAAHVFAVASLVLKWGNAGLVREPFQLEPGRLVFTEETRGKLAILPDSITRAEFYGVLCGALYGLQQEIPQRLEGSKDAKLLPVMLQGHGHCNLYGHVTAWLRPRFDPHRPFRRLRRDRNRLADALHRSRRQSLAPHPSRFLDEMGMIWNSDPEQPSVEPWEAPEHPSLVSYSGFDVVRKHCFRVALCPLDVLANPEFRAYQGDDGGCYFHAVGPDSLSGSEALHEHLRSVIEATERQHVQLLVLPELMVDAPARQALKALLQRYPSTRFPYAVVAGSFHLWRDGETPGTHMPVNESITLARNGDVLLRHHKRGRFRVPSERVKNSPRFFPGAHDDCPEEVVEVVEGIRHEASVQVLETTLGRIVVAICADCIAPDRSQFTSFLSKLDPDLVIIISMSDETVEFEELATTLARGEISSLFVNACCVCDPRNRPLLAGAHLAFWEPRGAPPTRVRWRCGEAGPEVRYFHPEDLPAAADDEEKQKKKDWRSLSDAPGETGVEWLHHGGENLGLVVDLGVHWGWTGDL